MWLHVPNTHPLIPAIDTLTVELIACHDLAPFVVKAFQCHTIIDCRHLAPVMPLILVPASHRSGTIATSPIVCGIYRYAAGLLSTIYNVSLISPYTVVLKPEQSHSDRS